jgi:OmpA-OmpF porin, OOP family
VQDSDGDGVNDSLDRCQSTATSVRVDASGCALDADADGVIDIHDRCPNTPAGTAVDAAGCPLDSDLDGVPNALDRCPDTPAGTTVGSTGCALDSDADGVPDAIDRCPGTSAGTRVDAWGCLLLFEEDRKSLILEGVNFADGRAELTPESSSILDNVAASLLANKTVRVVVEGHTSSTGSRVLNLGLSWARAAAVRDYLIAREVSPDRLVARGFGPDRPIATNATPEGQAKNRRVELRKTSEEGAR